MNIGARIRSLLVWVTRLNPRNKLIAAIGAGVLAVALIALGLSAGGQSCSSRADVEARVSIVSSGLQQQAAQGKIKVEDLATRIRRMNEAATAYNTTQDLGAYCEALDKLREDFALEN